MKKLLSVILVTSVFAVFVSLTNPSQIQASATLYVTPASAAVNNGENIAISVRVNTAGEQINAVQANLSYSQDKLQFLNIDASTSAFSVPAENSGGSGIVRIARSLAGGQAPLSGDFMVAIVNFKAIASGSASVSFDSSSLVAKAVVPAVDILGTSTGGAYTINTPTASPAPTNTNKQNTTSKSTTSTTNTNQPPKTNPVNTQNQSEKLVVSSVAVVELGLQRAVITWKTNKPATSQVNYSQQKDLQLTASDDNLTTNHRVELKNALLPGKDFYFKVSSAASNGERADGNISTFRTKGYLVKIKVTDRLGKPVKGASVTLYSNPLKAITDEKGIATFKDVSPEKHSVLIKTDGQTFAQEITVKESSEPTKAQDYSIKTQKTPSSNILVIAYSILVGMIAILLGIIVWLTNKKKNNAISN